jgi:cell division protein FtsN
VTKDYKNTDRKNAGRAHGSSGSLLLGILIGLVMGLAIALGVAWYINKMPSPFLDRRPPKTEQKPMSPAVTRGEEKAGTSSDAKPRFDFYRILPGTEEPATDQQVRDAQKQPTPAAREAFFLQAGAFQKAGDADNLKARLALLGVEASIQTTTLPDRGVCHRVRIGPYTGVEELNRTRDTLKQNGVETTLIKVRDGAQN